MNSLNGQITIFMAELAVLQTVSSRGIGLIDCGAVGGIGEAAFHIFNVRNVRAFFRFIVLILAGKCHDRQKEDCKCFHCLSFQYLLQ